MVTSRVEQHTYKESTYKHPNELRASFPNVYGMNVQIQQGSAAPLTVALKIDEPEANADIAFSLVDLLNGMRPEQPQFQFRQQNLLASNPNTGSWTDWTTQPGRTLLVAPT